MTVHHFLHRWASGVVCLLAAVACGGSSTNSTQDATTSTSVASDVTTSSAAGSAPTTAAVTDPDAIAQEKVRAALEALPDTWQGTVASDLGEEGDSGDDIVFAACLQPGDYNLDNLDADSAASWELDAEGPNPGSPVGGQQASLEGRVFADATTADAAFAVLERVLGTDEGRACLAAEVPGQLASELPADGEIDATVEGPAIEGAQVGARLVFSFNAGGFSGVIYVDLVASHPHHTCTVFATFVSFGTPVDQEVASAMFTAASEAPG